MNRLSKAIRVAASAKALLLHVQRSEKPFFSEPSKDEFCGTSLFRANTAISPMLLALSMELVLKAWIIRYSEKPDPPKSHDLLKLFRALPAGSQDQLRSRYDLEVLGPRGPLSLCSDLEGTLESARDAFIDWRYVHELERASFSTSPFIEIIEMMLTEFEKSIVVVKHPPPMSSFAT